MIQALLHLITRRPQLLADHAQAYAELVADEWGQTTADWRRRALLSAAALCCVGVTAVLAGVALMLWAMMPAAPGQVTWMLGAVPLAPAAGAWWCLRAARASSLGGAFDNVRRQMSADLQMLREESAP